MLRRNYFALMIGLVFLGACSGDPVIGDYDVSLPGGYLLARESPDSVEVLHETDSRRLGVPSKVVEIAWNDHFIIAKQQELKKRADFPGDEMLVPVPDKFNYWVIDLAQTNRYGPMLQSEYTSKLQSLGQTGLELKSVSEIRKKKR